MLDDIAADILNDTDVSAPWISSPSDRRRHALPPARLSFTHLPEAVEQLKSAFSRSGLNAWVAVSDLPAYADVSHIVTVGGVTHRVLDRERVAGSVRFRVAIGRGRERPLPLTSVCRISGSIST